MNPLVQTVELERLEETIQRALTSGDESELCVLGYGEISAVIAWPTSSGKVACKRLPPFPDRARYAAYKACAAEYIARMRASGVPVVDTEMHRLTGSDGRPVAYCVQPVLDGARLAPEIFRTRSDADVGDLFDQLVARITGFVDDTHGLDGQLSNWILGDDDQLAYLDVTTPLMRDENGDELLDQTLFIASLPWALRPVVRRFFLQEILDKYYDPRGVILDVLGNLHKERLAHLIPALLERVNPHLPSPITEAGIQRYYRQDARTWGVLQKLRRADRAWQRRVRRRIYPFLLPGAVER